MRLAPELSQKATAAKGSWRAAGMSVRKSTLRINSRRGERQRLVRTMKVRQTNVSFSEQTLFFRALSIRGERGAIFSELRRNKMKLRLAMLIWVAVLLAAAPVWADRVSCCNCAKEGPVDFSAGFGHGLDANSPISSLGSLRFVVDDTFFSSSLLGESVSDVDLRDLGRFERFTDHTEREHRRVWIDGGPKVQSDDAEGDGPSSTPVPEPGSLALLLVGLTGLGAFIRKR